MSQTYLCKNLGFEEGEGHLLEWGLLLGDYGTVFLQIAVALATVARIVAMGSIKYGSIKCVASGFSLFSFKGALYPPIVTMCPL